MKYKKSVFSILLLSFMIISCKQINVNSEENGENEASEAFLTVNLQALPSRTILPENYNYSDFEYELYGTDSDGNQCLLQYWTNYETMTSSKINIKTGEWIFEIHAIKNGEIVLTGLFSTRIQLGENRISFQLTELSAGKGNLFIELYVSENIAKKIEAVLLDEDGSYLTDFENADLVIEYDSTKEKNKAIYQLNNIPKGYYLVRFFLYKNDTDTKYSLVYNTFVRIEPCFTSSGIEEIDLLESLYEVSIPLDYIEIATKPNTTIYYADQNLSLEGLEVNACYKDGRKEKITNYATSIENGTKLTQTDRLVTIVYGEFTDSFEIQVLPNTIEIFYVTVPSMEQRGCIKP